MPAVVVGTDEFLQLGILESKARGMPDLRFAITRHPIGGLRPPLVTEKAAAMAEDAFAALTQEHGLRDEGRGEPAVADRAMRR